MKTALKLSLMLVLLLVTAGCGGAQPLSEEQQAAVLEFSEPMADNLLLAMNAGDYTLFARDLDEAMLTSIDAAGFDDMRAQINGKIGDYLSREVTSVTMAQGFYIVVYTARYELDEPVAIRLVFHVDEPHLITGLWFDSAKLRE